MTRPRLVLMVPIFPQLSETFVVSKAVGLLDRGWDVYVVCAESDPHRWAAFGADHPVHRLRSRVHTTLPTSTRRAGPSFVRAVAALALRHRRGMTRYLRVARRSNAPLLRSLFVDAPLIALAPDLVHFEFGPTALRRTDLAERLGCTMSVSFRGSDLNVIGLDVPGYYEEIWANVVHIHVLGSTLADQARRRGASDAAELTTIAPAVDVPVLDPADDADGVERRASLRPEQDRTPDPLRILMVGRLHWTKGYQYALEALSALRAQGVVFRCRIIGGGDLLEAVAFWRHQLGLDDVVDLLGPTAPGQVAEHYRWAEVFLHTAVTEGFGNVVLEAQAYRVPVVCADSGGLTENVEDGVTGFIVPRRDPSMAADALARLAREPALRSRLGAAGRARVEEQFRLENQIHAWELFYERAANSVSSNDR